MWLKIESAIEMTSNHMKTNVENQIMSHAPSPVKRAYFDNLYKSIAADAETRALEAQNWKKQLELEQRELDLREQSLQLRESLQRADFESELLSSPSLSETNITNNCIHLDKVLVSLVSRIEW